MEENIKSGITLGKVKSYITWLINNSIDEFGRPVIIAEVYRLTGMKVLLQTTGLTIMRITESQIRVGNSIGKHMDFSLLHYAAWFSDINDIDSSIESEVVEVLDANENVLVGPNAGESGEKTNKTPNHGTLSEVELSPANPLLVKVFSSRADELEKTLGDWLVENPSISIQEWLQSATTQDYRVCTVLTIIYTKV